MTRQFEQKKEEPGELEKEIALILSEKQIEGVRYDAPWKVLGNKFKKKNPIDALRKLESYGVLKLVPLGRKSYYKVIKEGLEMFYVDYCKRG